MSTLSAAGVIVIVLGLGVIAWDYGVIPLQVQHPDFCDDSFPIEKVEDYKGYEIWQGTNTYFDPNIGLAHKAIYWELTHPNDSWGWTIQDVRNWIDLNLEPIEPELPPEEEPPTNGEDSIPSEEPPINGEDDIPVTPIEPPDEQPPEEEQPPTAKDLPYDVFGFIIVIFGVGLLFVRRK